MEKSFLIYPLLEISLISFRNKDLRLNEPIYIYNQINTN